MAKEYLERMDRTIDRSRKRGPSLAIVRERSLLNHKELLAKAAKLKSKSKFTVELSEDEDGSAAIAVRGYDERGEPVGREFTDWEAHLFQHEFDHLDGILFPYRVVDPRHMVTAEALERREEWPSDWPTPGAREAPIRQIRPADPPGGLTPKD